MLFMIKYDLVNVLDVEATCYPDKLPFPAGERQEIIEIGVAVVDPFKRKIVDREQIVVKPVHSTVTPFCTHLTGWTKDELDARGVLFAEAVHRLNVRFDPANRLWVSQGQFDRTMFETQCGYEKVDYPFGDEHISVPAMFAILTGRTKNTGLEKMMRMFGIQPEGQMHRAYNDAYNLARVFLEIRRRGNFFIR